MNQDALLQLYYLVRSLHWNNQVGSLTNEAQQLLIRHLQDAQQGLRKTITKKIQKWASVLEWTPELEQEVVDSLVEALGGSSTAVTEFITSTAVGTATATIAEYNALMSLDGKAKGVKLMEGLTQAQIKQFFEEQPLGGKLLKEWVKEGFDDSVQASILNAIREGILKGEGYEALVERVMTSVDIGFIRTRRDITMLVKTYVQSANVGAQEAVFKENEDVIKGYTRRETLDNRTCRLCALNDGLFYKTTEKRPSLPAHPSCRGLWIPKTKSFRELGIDREEFDEVLRSWSIREDGSIGTGGKKTLSYGTVSGNFGDWFNSLSDKDKAKTSIGPVRTRLLKAGAVEWRQLVDKKTGRPYLLDELGFDQNGQKIGE